jgi:hypothetical protein
VTASEGTAPAGSTDGTDAAASQWQAHLQALLLINIAQCRIAGGS